METTTAERQRKLITLPMDVFKNLSVKATSEGLNLAQFIENICIQEAAAMTDEELYSHLRNTRPEGKQYISGNEKREFETFLGL